MFSAARFITRSRPASSSDPLLMVSTTREWLDIALDQIGESSQDGVRAPTARVRPTPGNARSAASTACRNLVRSGRRHRPESSAVDRTVHVHRLGRRDATLPSMKWSPETTTCSTADIRHRHAPGPVVSICRSRRSSLGRSMSYAATVPGMALISDQRQMHGCTNARMHGCGKCRKAARGNAGTWDAGLRECGNAGMARMHGCGECERGNSESAERRNPWTLMAVRRKGDSSGNATRRRHLRSRTS